MRNLEHRLSKVNVMVADRDARMASLVHGVLRNFGFQSVDLATTIEHVAEAVSKKPFGLIITEWQLASSDGVQLVKAIRGSKTPRQVRRDIPIIMLTARSDVETVKRARDAGITEFLAKPFSAKTMSHRLIQVIDHPRLFVDAEVYTGPCRRRRGEAPPEGERRGRKKGELPPNRELQDVIGRDITAADIFNDELIAKVQREIQAQEGTFITWANEDIAKLETAFGEISKDPASTAARETILVGSPGTELEFAL